MTAACEGVSASKLFYRETFGAFSGEWEGRDLVETYIPVKRPDGAVEGVSEFYTDVTPMMARIARTTLRMASGLMEIFGALYVVLVLFVRRADRIVKGQYEDLLRSRVEIEELSAALAREMDERQKALSALRHAHDAPEARVREQTEEHRQATKMEAVGQMTGGVTHDFNNLLAVIQGNLEILDDGMGRDDGRAAYVARVMAAAERGGALTRRLLTFAPKQPIAPGLTDLNALVVETSELFRPTLGAAVNVEIALAEDAPRTLVNRRELENALANLVIDARDAMPGGGKLRIASGVVNVSEKDGAGSPPPGRYLTLTIRDIGTGMAPEVAVRLCSILYDQGGGRGQRPRPQYGLSVHRACRRPCQDRERGRPRHPCPKLSARGRGGGGVLHRLAAR
jgi:signal transduction histidine kinase